MIKSNHDNNLDEMDIEYMSKQEFFFPASTYEYEIQLLTYISFIGLISGFKSILTKQLTT
jgi:hypothetical protein